MGWSIGYDNTWKRDIGYGVPATCDFPKCDKEIDRGLSYVCGSEPYGGEQGCGLYFCTNHFSYRKPRGYDRMVQNCPRCMRHKPPFNPKPDCVRWIKWKLKDESWEGWRKSHREEVKRMKSLVHPLPK